MAPATRPGWWFRRHPSISLWLVFRCAGPFGFPVQNVVYLHLHRLKFQSMVFSPAAFWSGKEKVKFIMILQYDMTNCFEAVPLWDSIKT